MNSKLEEKFKQFAEAQQETLKESGLTVEDFIKDAMMWAESEEGKLELNKMLLMDDIKEIESEINEIKSEIAEKNSQINELNNKISKKQKAIDEIDVEIKNL